MGVSIVNAALDDGTQVDLTLFGVDPDGFLAPGTSSGAGIGQVDGIVVSETAREQGLELGSIVTLDRTDVEFEVIGFTEGQSTFGHVDVIGRAASIFDRVVVGVVGAPQHKTPMFSLDERVAFLREALGDLDNVEVDVFSELVVEFARRWQAKAIVKGLRVISDFEWEFQMNQLNRTLAPEIETVYVMASPQVSFVSSSGVKEIAAFGGDVSDLVPATVAERFKALFPNGRPGTPERPTE